MLTSPLQLEASYIKELHFLMKDHPKDLKPVENPAVKVSVKAARKTDDPLHWSFELNVGFDEATAPKMPFEFTLVMLGFFKVNEKYPAEQAEKLANTNGPAVLYSATREVIASLTGRNGYSPLVLPTVTFIHATGDQIKEKPRSQRMPRVIRKRG